MVTTLSFLLSPGCLQEPSLKTFQCSKTSHFSSCSSFTSSYSVLTSLPVCSRMFPQALSCDVSTVSYTTYQMPGFHQLCASPHKTLLLPNPGLKLSQLFFDHPIFNLATHTTSTAVSNHQRDKFHSSLQYLKNFGLHLTLHRELSQSLFQPPHPVTKVENAPQFLSKWLCTRAQAAIIAPVARLEVEGPCRRKTCPSRQRTDRDQVQKFPTSSENNRTSTKARKAGNLCSFFAPSRQHRHYVKMGHVGEFVLARDNTRETSHRC